MYDGFVALFTRAWIEIARITPTTINYKSPSSRGRGLKSAVNKANMEEIVSPSSRGRGLKSDVKSAFYVMN